MKIVFGKHSYYIRKNRDHLRRTQGNDFNRTSDTTLQYSEQDESSPSQQADYSYSNGRFSYPESRNNRPYCT